MISRPRPSYATVFIVEPAEVPVTVTTVGYNEVGTDAPTTSYRVISLVVMVLGVGTSGT